MPHQIIACDPVTPTMRDRLSGSNLMKIELGVGKMIHQLENIFLLVIALLTVIGACKEIYVIADKRDVDLQDLLLMFLYVEVLCHGRGVL
jgi:hypothetical protein